jgi:hypothetical protein
MSGNAMTCSTKARGKRFIAHHALTTPCTSRRYKLSVPALEFAPYVGQKPHLAHQGRFLKMQFCSTLHFFSAFLTAFLDSFLQEPIYSFKNWWFTLLRKNVIEKNTSKNVARYFFKENAKMREQACILIKIEKACTKMAQSGVSKKLKRGQNLIFFLVCSSITPKKTWKNCA